MYDIITFRTAVINEALTDDYQSYNAIYNNNIFKFKYVIYKLQLYCFIGKHVQWQYAIIPCSVYLGRPNGALVSVVNYCKHVVMRNV